MNFRTVLTRTGDEVASFFRWFYHTKPVFVSSVMVALLLPGYVLVITAFLPAERCVRTRVPADSLQVDTTLRAALADTSRDWIGAIRETWELEREKTFLVNRYTLAQQDSVYLCLDLADTLLTMEIQGVVVRRCSPVSLRVSHRFRCYDQEELLAWLSSPFTLQRDLSTIPKVPYAIKQAPKDTTEAALQSAVPMAPDTSAVFFMLFFDRNLVIEVEQSETPQRADKATVRSYQKTLRRAERKQVIQALLRATPPDQEIRIHLIVDQADARAIYRGIPVFAKLALKLDGTGDP